MRYIGRVTTVLPSKSGGFIGISSVSPADGETVSERLVSTGDVFLHGDDCEGQLRVGMEVKFIVVDDLKRGKGFYRAKCAEETDESKLERLMHNGITLGIQGFDGTRLLVHSSVTVSWCLTRELVEKIKRICLEGQAVRLLLVYWKKGASYYKCVELRQLVDITEPMAVISFDAPGEYRLMTFMVFGPSEAQLRNRYTSRSDGRHNTDVVSEDGVTVMLREKDWVGSDYADVEVPEELFAKRPRDWKWVNYFFKSKPKDQCAYRRRRIFAYTLQPVAVLVIFIFLGIIAAFMWLCSLVAALALLSVGTRGLNYDPLLHPLGGNKPSDLWSDLKRPVFIPVIKGFHVPLPLAFSPLVLVVATLITWLASADTFGTVGWFVVFVEVMQWPFYVFAFITLVVVLIERIDWDECEARQRARAAAQLSAGIDALACSLDDSHSPDVLRRPLSRRLFRFYALRAKQAVCMDFPKE